jgi:hypothetical protein
VLSLRIMGRTNRRYEKVAQLPPSAIPIQLYADRIKRARVYIYVHYDRFRKGFKKNGKTYYSADPGYKIVTYHNACYVIENE